MSIHLLATIQLNMNMKEIFHTSLNDRKCIWSV